MRAATRVIVVAYLAQARDRLTEPSFLWPLLIQPVLIAAIATILFERTGSRGVLLYGVIGSGLVGLWNTNLWSSGWIVESERWQGTLELLLAAPARWEDALLGKSFCNSSFSVASMLVTLVVAAYGFRVPVTLQHPGAFAAALMLTVVAVTCLGLLLGALFVLSRAASRAGEIMNYPIFILSGLLFPITVLPMWTRPLSFTLAPTWSAQALRWSAAQPQGWPWGNYLMLVLLGAVYYGAARCAYAVVERKVRRDGTLGYY